MRDTAGSDDRLVLGPPQPQPPVAIAIDADLDPALGVEFVLIEPVKQVDKNRPSRNLR